MRRGDELRLLAPEPADAGILSFHTSLAASVVPRPLEWPDQDFDSMVTVYGFGGADDYAREAVPDERLPLYLRPPARSARHNSRRAARCAVQPVSMCRLSDQLRGRRQRR